MLESGLVWLGLLVGVGPPTLLLLLLGRQGDGGVEGGVQLLPRAAAPQQFTQGSLNIRGSAQYCSVADPDPPG